MKQEARFVPASRDYTVGDHSKPIEDHLPAMKWSERLKTDRAFSRPPYLVKSSAQALQVALSPFWAVPDLVRPQFIRDGDHLYAQSVENLVLSVRAISSKTHQVAQLALKRIPFYDSILDIIARWDVEAINRELTMLQREPKGRTFADFIPLVRVLLPPLFRLSKLNPHVHLIPAVTKMFELARMNLPNKEERDLLLRYYQIARDELPEVFTHLRQRMYPVLMKLICDKYIDLDPFYIEKEGEILAFLGLDASDLVTDDPDAPEEVPEAPPPPTVIPEPPPIPRLVHQGFEWLDRMFPKAGWKNLEAQPDLYGYFQTVFDYPKGSDLIPPNDPVHVIQPLSEILQQLFYGFQTIQWGTAKGAGGETVRLQEEFEKVISRWHFFHEEFFGKNYLALLQEYCREVERSGPLAPDSKRRETQLLWLKRNYLLPHLLIPALEDVRVKSLGYPNLAVQVREMLDLLAPIAVEVEQKGTKSTSILNPEVRARFPVATMVGTRFLAILRRTDETDQGDRRILDQGNNKSLLLASVALLGTLDYLLSNQTSPLYQWKTSFLYRTSGHKGDDKPVYNAPKKNSLALLKRLNEQPPPTVAEVPWPSRGGEVFGPLVAAEEVKKRIRNFLEEKKPFSVLSLRVWPDEARKDFTAFATLALPEGQRLHPQDDGSWICVLRDTPSAAAEELARKMVESAARRDPPLAVGVLSVSFIISWSAEKMLSLPAKGWSKARELTPPILGVWDHTKQAFEFKPAVLPSP